MKTLIVEDDSTSGLLMQELLRSYGRSRLAVNGREAVEAVGAALEAGHPYDLICMDLMLPEMDGQQALKAIRSLERARGVNEGEGAKIVMTTALGDMPSVVAAVSNQCDAYLTKPIRKAKLLQELRRLSLIA